MKSFSSRRKFLSTVTTLSMLGIAGCSSSPRRTDATVILSNLLETEQTAVVRIFDDNDSKVWEQQAELPAAQPNEAPSIRTENALQSVEMGAEFSVEVTAESIEKTATGSLTIDCEDHEHIRIRLMKRYEGGEPVIDFRSC